jgi:hypothetical protein
MFQIKVVQRIKTHILCSQIFFSPENRAVYEIIWKKKMLELQRPQMTIWRMRVECWIRLHTRACTHTHTHTEKYAILLFHGNNDFLKALQFYITRTLPVFLHMYNVPLM